ncbi:alpha/beta fold hydrolase [Flavobacteriaceae bacterium AU392]|nr:alpha/beta hydrolase [Flavobacteriaceae bacterium]RKM85159.1 alpha/beta fold hydrolase [Flavobacteriaceae bacterium AU392]
MKTIKKTLVLLIILFSNTIITLNAQEKGFEVRVIGKGEPVLLFPGFTCTGDVWSEAVKELSKTNTCHIFTFAGFGGVKPIKKPWLPKIKESIINYISEKKLENATLIGHSLGGTLGLWLAINNNEFKKVIVVDALPSAGALMIPNFKSEDMVYDNPYNKQLLEMDAEGFEKMATLMSQGMALNKEKHAQIKDWILKSDRETYVYGYTDLLKLDLRTDISKIKIPVTILAATHPYGEETVKKTYTEQYKNLKAYTIKYAKASAHFIMYDQPKWLLNIIKTELE